MLKFLLCYLLIINGISYVAFGLDLLKAKASAARTSEMYLLLLAIVGGSIGAWYGMKVWRHKTLHKKFRYGLPFIMTLQLFLTIFILNRL